MQTILLTGFEPFGGDAVNPSEQAVRILAAGPPPGLRLVTAILPVSYARMDAALAEAIARARPDAVVAVGLAASRAEMSVERVAINLDDARIPDNDGAQPIDVPVVAGGPAAYFSTLPIKAIVARMREAGVPAHVSQTAGTFGCNHIFYLARHLAETHDRGMRAGFIHVPGPANMKLASVVTGLRAALETVRDTTTDLRVAEGATS